MKAKLLKLGAAAILICACVSLALAQDKDHDHDRDKAHHKHSTTHRTVRVTTTTHYIRHRGGTQSVTYYHYTPRRRYSQADWDDRIRASRAKWHKSKHSTNWWKHPTRRHTTNWWAHPTRRRTVVIHRTTVHHDNGLHLGWQKGRHNPHRDSDNDRDDRKHHDRDRGHDRDKDRDHDKHVSISEPGFYLASLNYNPQDRRGDQRHRRGEDRYNRYRYRYAAGHYTSVSDWSRRGQHFVIRYIINLSSEGTARLEATSLEDRNMPNDRHDTDHHGDILVYMHSGHDVIQHGDWDQHGDDVTIRLSDIEYGHTRRYKSETLRGRLRNNELHLDSWDRNFYGSQFDPTFRKD